MRDKAVLFSFLYLAKPLSYHFSAFNEQATPWKTCSNGLDILPELLFKLGSVRLVYLLI